MGIYYQKMSRVKIILFGFGNEKEKKESRSLRKKI